MPAAFNHMINSAINNTIRTLYCRRKMVGTLSLTHEEYMETFVPREARDAFRAAAPWASRSEGRHYRWDLELLTGEKYTATMQINENVNRAPAPIVPRTLAIQPDAPSEIVGRIFGWATTGGDVSREFGRVRLVFDTLNEQFSRITMRYYWPTILALLSENKDTKHLVAELQELKTPAKPKPLPQGLLLACKQTAETIASARLIPADIQEPEPGEVDIDIAPGQKYQEHLGTFYGME